MNVDVVDFVASSIYGADPDCGAGYRRRWKNGRRRPCRRTSSFCCDGTGNEYGRHNTNVVKLFEAVVRDENQTAFYDPGIGTFSVLGRRLGRPVGIVLGKAFGYGLRQNIEDAYRYLMDRYQPDDKLFLFGFSRGAYTVRALAGMLYRCGLLQKGSVNLLPYVSRIYHTGDPDNVASGFKRTYCHECRPYVIGVWDTVGSLGWFLRRTFFDTKLNHDVTYGYHAVSIDERRGKFPVSLWNDAVVGKHQTVEQVWFPGVHSDVGGWYPEPGLSDIALIWMLEKVQSCGMRLKSDWHNALTPDPSGLIHNSRVRFWRLLPSASRRIQTGALVHRSVQARMDDKALRYEPSNLPLQGHYRVVD